MDTTYAWFNVTTSIVMNVVLSNKKQKLGTTQQEVMGGFQLLNLIITELKSHMTC